MYSKTKYKRQITATLTKAFATLTDAEALKKAVPTLAEHQAEGIAYAFKSFIKGVTDGMKKQLDKARNDEEARAIMEGLLEGASSAFKKIREETPLLAVTVKVNHPRKITQKTAKRGGRKAAK